MDWEESCHRVLLESRPRASSDDVARAHTHTHILSSFSFVVVVVVVVVGGMVHLCTARCRLHPRALGLLQDSLIVEASSLPSSTRVVPARPDVVRR